jgi:putative PIN family toxin of toxin-antitoxin system
MTPARLRAVFDCMIFLQAATRSVGPAGACVALAEEGLIELLVSEEIVAEIDHVLRRPRIRAKFPSLTDDLVVELVSRIERVAIIVADVPSGIRLARDPKDEPYLNLAKTCAADYLVTRDKDLLEAGDDILGQIPGLMIVDPAAFLTAVRGRLSAAPQPRMN